MARLLHWFTAHPESVGESYLQHLAHASLFAVRMIGGGLACFVHALLPFLFVKTGSRTITELHHRMGTRPTEILTPLTVRPREGRSIPPATALHRRFASAPAAR